MRGVFPSKVLQLHQQRLEILRVDSLVLWKIIDEEDAVLTPKNRGENFSSGFFALGIFGGGVSRYAANPLIVLCPGHSDTTRFRPWSPIALDRKSLGSRRKKFQMLLRRLAQLMFLIHVYAFRDPFRAELPHVQIFMNDGPNPLT